MTTTFEASLTIGEATIDTRCPAYCNLPPGHTVDNNTGDGKGSFRIHSGPSFGDFIHSFAEEYVSEPGVLYIGIDLVSDPDAGDGELLSAAQLNQLAARAQVAAAWLTTRLTEPNTRPAVKR